MAVWLLHGCVVAVWLLYVYMMYYCCMFVWLLYRCCMAVVWLFIKEETVLSLRRDAYEYDPTPRPMSLVSEVLLVLAAAVAPSTPPGMASPTAGWMHRSCCNATQAAKSISSFL